MALKDIAYTAEEAKEEQKEWAEGGPVPKYPYGLCLSLDDETIKKLGLPMPVIGAQMRIEAVATVTSLSANQDAKGEAENYVSLQITALDVAPLSTTADTANKLYGAKS